MVDSMNETQYICTKHENREILKETAQKDYAQKIVNYAVPIKKSNTPSKTDKEMEEYFSQLLREIKDLMNNFEQNNSNKLQDYLRK